MQRVPGRNSQSASSPHRPHKAILVAPANLHLSLLYSHEAMPAKRYCSGCNKWSERDPNNPGRCTNCSKDARASVCQQCSTPVQQGEKYCKACWKGWSQTDKRPAQKKAEPPKKTWQVKEKSASSKGQQDPAVKEKSASSKGQQGPSDIDEGTEKASDVEEVTPMALPPCVCCGNQRRGGRHKCKRCGMSPLCSVCLKPYDHGCYREEAPATHCGFCPACGAQVKMR